MKTLVMYFKPLDYLPWLTVKENIELVCEDENKNKEELIVC